MITLAQIVIRLVISAFLCALIGLERETRHRPAGVRTITLVGAGSTMIMLISLQFSTFDGGDPSRLVSGILTALGLLGTGVIIRGSDQVEVQGITTAATIFMAGGIGLAVGLGMYAAGIFATLLTLLILSVFDSNRFGAFFSKK